MPRRKAYVDTKVGVDRSRQGIAKILEAWGAAGITWDDDLSTGDACLRFRWSVADGKMLHARLRLVPQRSAMARTPKQVAEHRDRERRRLHRVAFHWLKVQHEAVEAGLFEAPAVLLPWLEDGEGKTVAEVLVPRLDALANGDLGRRLALPSS